MWRSFPANTFISRRFICGCKEGVCSFEIVWGKYCVYVLISGAFSTQTKQNINRAYNMCNVQFVNPTMGEISLVQPSPAPLIPFNLVSENGLLFHSFLTLALHYEFVSWSRVHQIILELSNLLATNDAYDFHSHFTSVKKLNYFVLWCRVWFPSPLKAGNNTTYSQSPCPFQTFVNLSINNIKISFPGLDTFLKPFDFNGLTPLYMNSSSPLKVPKESIGMSRSGRCMENNASLAYNWKRWGHKRVHF